MAYPWAGFGSFLFQRSEQPLHDTDTGWDRNPSVARSRPLGSATDSIVTLAVGSSVRSFECHLAPTRFATLQALVNTAATFVDWDRPTPGSQSAFLQRISRMSTLGVLCEDGATRKRIRTLVELISQ